MKRGKRICNALKAVRRHIADENGIELNQAECKHTGDCLGTCPKCEAEARYLEHTLMRHVTAGQAATIAGLTLSLAACGGTTEPILSIDTPLDTIPADTTGVTDTIVNDNTDIPIPGIDESLGVIESDLPDTPDTSAIEEDDELLGVIIEESPSFPGGEKALYDFINNNLHYPEAACEANVSGTVVVCFAVETDGTISNVRIMRDLGYGCGEEAVRLVKLMPKWNPGKQEGIIVRTEFSLPVRFIPNQNPD